MNYCESVGKLNQELSTLQLPTSEEIARGGYGQISCKVRDILQLVMDAENAEKNGELREAFSGQTKMYVDYQIETMMKILEEQQSEECCIDDNNDQWDSARAVAESFPIGSTLLHDPDSLTTGKRPRRIVEIQDRLLQDIYRYLTDRPKIRQVNPSSRRSMLALRRSCRTALRCQPQSEMTIEEKRRGRGFNFMDSLGLDDEAKIDIDPKDSIWPYRFKEAAEKRSNVTDRCYVTLSREALGDLGVHFIGIIDALRVNGIPIVEAKAASPAEAQNRKDSMVLYLPKDKREQVEQVIQSYNASHHCLDNLSATTDSTNPGIAWGREPSDVEKNISNIVHVSENSGSFNGFRAALVYFILLQKLVTNNETDTAAKLNYQREIDRIRPFLEKQS